MWSKTFQFDYRPDLVEEDFYPNQTCLRYTFSVTFYHEEEKRDRNLTLIVEKGPGCEAPGT